MYVIYQIMEALSMESEDTASLCYPWQPKGFPRHARVLIKQSKAELRPSAQKRILGLKQSWGLINLCCYGRMLWEPYSVESKTHPRAWLWATQNHCPSIPTTAMCKLWVRVGSYSLQSVPKELNDLKRWFLRGPWQDDNGENKSLAHKR